MRRIIPQSTNLCLPDRHASELYVEYDGLRLPPKPMRLGSMPKKGDDVYVNYARGSVRLLEQYAGASREDRIADIGCGPGRLLIGMQARWGTNVSYRGLDVDRSSIDWARNWLASPPEITFERLNVRNDRYNPDGRDLDETFRLPLKTGSADLVVLFSVFSHMFLEDINIYLTEMARVLSAAGRVTLTLFVEDDVPGQEENPHDYLAKWRGPLHCVRILRSRFNSLLFKHDFVIDSFEHHKMASGQSLYVLKRKVERRT